MSFTVDTDEAAGAIIINLARDFSLEHEYQDFRAEILAALNAQTKPVALIFDVREVNLSSRDMLISTDEESQQLLKHPNSRENIIITEDPLLQMAARGVNSFSFGFIKVRSFPNLEAALEYTRAQAGV